MNKSILLFFLLLHQFNCSAQQPCNRKAIASQYEKMLPKEVCIPPGYFVAMVFDATDVDGDGLFDFIFEWQKPNMQDGDSSYVSIYRRLDDSTYLSFKTLSNIFPVYFKNYGDRDSRRPEKLAAIIDRYSYAYPLKDLTVEGTEIKITLENAAGEGNVLHYRYDHVINTWKLYKLEYWISGYLGKIRIEPRSLPEGKLLIEEFDYLDYMY